MNEDLPPSHATTGHLDHSYVRIHTAILEQERPPNEVRCVLRRVIAANGAVDEGLRKALWVGGVKEIGDVERRGWLTVEDTVCPALLGEAPVPGADIALGVRVHMRVAGMPEEPDVLLA